MKVASPSATEGPFRGAASTIDKSRNRVAAKERDAESMFSTAP